MKRVLRVSLGSALAMMAGTFAACGSDSTMTEVTTTSSANPAQYVVDTMTVPADKQTYAIDLNGDGKVDNQLGNIIGALASENLDTQSAVDVAIKGGSVVLLLTETSADATYMQDSAAGLKVQIGKEMANPDLTGNGTFTVDTASTGAELAGRISGGQFSSNSPVTTTHPVSVTIQLPLVMGGAPIPLNIVGAHIQFQYSSGKMTAGQIHGAIKNADVQAQIVPNVATLLNSRVAADPTNTTNKQILQLFDTGGAADSSCSGACKNPDGSCAVKGDMKVSVCEVSTNSIIKNVLNPDVQMFDASGNYHPNPDNTTKDCLSLGLGFTAAKAKF